MENNHDIKEAEAHLEQAKKALEAAERDEHAAQVAEKEALKDIEEAIDELKEAEHPEVHFTVNGEEHKTREPEQTPNHIIRHFAEKDPATNYLVQIKGTTSTSYQGKGEEKIRIHDCENFQTVSTGPTPVSAW